MGHYGFIRSDDGRDFFVHHTAIRATKGAFRTLVPGERYSFEIQESQRGPLAIGVVHLTNE
jgi:cold shock CspA family protein